MDSPLVVAFIGAIGSVIAVFIANRFTSRSARRAQRQAAEIERTKVDAQAYARARESYDAALATQTRRIAELQEEMVGDRAEYRSEIADCRSRIRELDEARRSDRNRMRALGEYVRVLIGVLRQHDIPFPAMPVELDEL